MASLSRRLDLRSTPRWQYFALIALDLYLVVLHRTLPLVSAPSLPVQASFVGPAKCLADLEQVVALTCPNLGYPVGFRNLQNFPGVMFVAFLDRYLQIPLVDGVQIFYTLCVLLGSLSLALYVWKWTGSLLAGLLASLLFHGSIFLIGTEGYPSLFPGFLLFPFYVGLGHYLLHRLHDRMEPVRPIQLALLTAAGFLIMAISVLVDGYSYVMAVITIGLFAAGELVHASYAKRGLDRPWLAVLLLCLLFVVGPGAVYQLRVFNAPAPGFPVDFFRAQGIDLITLFVPTQRMFFARVLHLGPAAWNPYAFYGDGTNANGNYLGIVTAAVGLLTLYLASFKSFGDKARMLTLGAILGLGFILSLGPSLKVASTRPAAQVTQPTYADYLMPPEAAVVSLPTEALFKLPVISTMRVTARWQLVTRFALAVLVGYFVAGFLGTRRVLVSLLCAIIVLENLPAGLLVRLQQGRDYRIQGQLFDSQVVDSLRPYIQAQRVLFLPAQTDYLVALIVPFTDSYTYNLSFDKEMTRILPLQPERILTVESLFNQDQLSSEDVCSLFKRDLVDKVVFTYFNLRWDSYSWPPAEQTVVSYRQRVRDLELNAMAGLRTSEEALFMVVGGNPESRQCAPR